MRRLRAMAALAAGTVLLVVAPAVSAAPAPPQITSTPIGTSTSGSVSFDFTGDATTTQFQCTLQGPTPSAAAPCASGMGYSGLANGSYTFSVQAGDATNAFSTATTEDFVVAVPVPDTTPPVISGLPLADVTAAATSPAGAVVTYTVPTATDNVDPTPTVNCAPASGSTFPLGTTSVTCTAADNATPPNQSTASFNVIVTDTTPPVISGLPLADVTAAATSPAGAVVTYTVPTATDNVDPTPTVNCAPASGSTFPLGTTSVTCTAADNATPPNQSTATFNVIVKDETGPTVAAHADVTVAATSPAGAVVTYALPTATDNIDPKPTVTCTPASGSTFPVSAAGTTVSCTATDAANNPSTNTTTFSVIVTETPPVVSVPAPMVVEADGPGGSKVYYFVSAQEFGSPLPPSSIGCGPGSGFLFPLGVTTVSCTAKDAANNVSAPQTFTVTVRDTTPPTINAPDASFTATSASGIRRTDAAVASYLAKISAIDLVSAVTLTTNTPATLPIGDTKIVVTARDAAGNEAKKTVTLTVLAQGKKAPPIDTTPPGPVLHAAAAAGDHTVLLSWVLPASKDVAFVRITRSVVGKTRTITVYHGLGTSFKSGWITNDVAYRFTLVAVDKAGNSSKSVVVSATPQAFLLASPKRGAVVTQPPLLRWAPVAGARYFNVQLYHGGTKVLSAWPTVAHLKITSRWTYAGRAFTLKPGVYVWYVWPGLGARADARYGGLLGSSSFAVNAPSTA